MIAGLEGVISAVGEDHVVLNVSGVHYRVFMPGSAIPALGRVGERAFVPTHLHVREDQLTLYGASDQRQLRMFETLLGVSGIGPKVALMVLSSMPTESLERAILDGNVDLLTRVPGIGRKTAARLVLELKGKLDILAAAGISVSPSAAQEVVEALSGLGYSPAEIQMALSGLPTDRELGSEEMVLLALRKLGR